MFSNVFARWDLYRMIPTVIFIGLLRVNIYSIFKGKYSIENLSAGNPEAANKFISWLDAGKISYGMRWSLNQDRYTVDSQTNIWIV